MAKRFTLAIPAFWGIFALTLGSAPGSDGYAEVPDHLACVAEFTAHRFLSTTIAFDTPEARIPFRDLVSIEVTAYRGETASRH